MANPHAAAQLNDAESPVDRSQSNEASRAAASPMEEPLLEHDHLSLADQARSERERHEPSRSHWQHELRDAHASRMLRSDRHVHAQAQQLLAAVAAESESAAAGPLDEADADAEDGLFEGYENLWNKAAYSVLQRVAWQQRGKRSAAALGQASTLAHAARAALASLPTHFRSSLPVPALLQYCLYCCV